MTSSSHNTSTRYSTGHINNKTFVEFNLVWSGRDLIIIITGGQSHIGALAFSEKAESHQIHQFTFKDHREDAIVRKAVEVLKEELTGEILVIGGIHYDDINQKQIAEINSNCDLLIKRIAADLKSL